MIICTARCARNTLLIDRQTAEAIGAKNGCGWPSTSLAMYQARPDAMAVCTVGNHTPRSRSMAARPPSATVASNKVLMTLAYLSA
jgi:hypothetical protein